MHVPPYLSLNINFFLYMLCVAVHWQIDISAKSEKQFVPIRDKKLQKSCAI